MGLPSTLDGAVVADFVGCADGWAGWQAETGEHGVVVTSPIVLGAGAALRVNIEQRTPGAGSARVELRHAANGTAIPGFEMATCRPIVADSPEAAVAWKGGGSLARLAGLEVVAAVGLQGGAAVYSLLL